MLKFKKYNRKQGVYWDAPADNGFYRIVVNMSGFYVVHHCKGLEANQVTPIGMTEVSRSLLITPCKEAAVRHYLKLRATNKQAAGGGYRLPYRED